MHIYANLHIYKLFFRRQKEESLTTGGVRTGSEKPWAARGTKMGSCRERREVQGRDGQSEHSCCREGPCSESDYSAEAQREPQELQGLTAHFTEGCRPLIKTPVNAVLSWNWDTPLWSLHLFFENSFISPPIHILRIKNIKWWKLEVSGWTCELLSYGPFLRSSCPQGRGFRLRRTWV